MNLHAPFRELYPSLWKTTNRAAQKTENIKNIDTLKRASLLRSHNPGNGFISVIKARGRIMSTGKRTANPEFENSSELKNSLSEKSKLFRLSLEVNAALNC